MELRGAITCCTENTYKQHEKKYGSRYERKCIDGTITGCGKCVGFCEYSGHPGFLTEKLRKNHKCLEKGCFYYIQKPASVHRRTEDTSFHSTLLSAAKKQTADMAGIKVISVTEVSCNHWCLAYVTITNAYSLHDVKKVLEAELNCNICLKKLNYSFDKCAQLILAE